MKNSSTTSIKHLDEPVPSKSSPVGRALVATIGLYQRFTSGRPSPCRFYPSCSNYAAEAIQSHGTLRGSALAIRRLSRCRPLGPHGVDLVPEPKKARSPQQ
jgi:putative membrane protein insertion efficiency factor